MAYFKINGHDYSTYVNKLSVQTVHKYISQESASGTLLVRYLTAKKKISVGIIPLDSTTLKSLMADINAFDVSVQYLEPETDALKSISCIIPTNSIDYYTIQAENKKVKAFTFTCEEK